MARPGIFSGSRPRYQIPAISAPPIVGDTPIVMKRDADAGEIEVRLPSDTKRAEVEIAARAVDILEWQIGFPADRITVKVEKALYCPSR